MTTKKTVFTRNTIRGVTRHAMTWSAMLMLLVQPSGLQAADCGCRSGTSSAVESNCGCSSVAIKSCCGKQDSCCCSNRPSLSFDESSCCAAPKSDLSSTCTCGDNCRCGSRDTPDAPAPVIPANDSTSKQTQLLILAIESTQGIDCVISCDDSTRSESARQFSLTARQVCALLSRFTC